MKHQKLKNNEAVPSGFTDLFILDTTDLAAGVVDNTNVEIALTTLKVGDIVWPNLLVEVKENADTVSSLTLTIGPHSGTAIIDGVDLLAAGTEYYVPAATVGAYPAVAEVALTALFDPGATDECHESTTGEFWVWVSISRAAERDVEA